MSQFDPFRSFAAVDLCFLLANLRARVGLLDQRNSTAAWELGHVGVIWVVIEVQLAVTAELQDTRDGTDVLGGGRSRTLPAKWQMARALYGCPLGHERFGETLDGLKEVGNRNRLGDIGVATTFEDLLFLALHHKSGDCNHRDRL